MPYRAIVALLAGRETRDGLKTKNETQASDCDTDAIDVSCGLRLLATMVSSSSRS